MEKILFCLTGNVVAKSRGMVSYCSRCKGKWQKISQLPQGPKHSDTFILNNVEVGKWFYFPVNIVLSYPLILGLTISTSHFLVVQRWSNIGIIIIEVTFINMYFIENIFGFQCPFHKMRNL